MDQLVGQFSFGSGDEVLRMTVIVKQGSLEFREIRAGDFSAAIPEPGMIIGMGSSEEFELRNWA